jgi:hypothetical protein
MQRGNELLFPTREHTRELIRSGRYTTLLEQFQPLLRDCRRDIDRLHREYSPPAFFRFPYSLIVLLRPVVQFCVRFTTHESTLFLSFLADILIANSTVPLYMRHILNIEYEYVRVYINSLALQAVVERCANATPGTVPSAATTAATNFNGAADHQPDHTRDATAPLPPLRTHTHMHMHPRGGGYGASVPFSALASLYGNDQGFVRELVDACRNLLQTVVEGLLPGGYLQHAPVRTYFRIVSGAMFLLKVGIGPCSSLLLSSLLGSLSLCPVE